MVNPHHLTRAGDPDTSFQAALSLEDRQVNLLKATIYDLLKATGPLPDTDICLALSAGWSESGIRTRRSELVKEGLVRDSGGRTVLPSGRRAILWEAV